MFRIKSTMTMSGSSILSGRKSVPSIDTLKRLYCPLVRVLKANSLGRSMILLPKPVFATKLCIMVDGFAYLFCMLSRDMNTLELG